MEKVQVKIELKLSIMRTFNHFKDTHSAFQYVYILALAWLPQVFTKVSPFITREMKHFKIMPDLVDEVPPFGCQIDYGEECADFGNLVMSYEVEKEPRDTFWPADEGKLYTLIMVGLDMIEPDEKYRRPSGSHDRLHWLVVNIPEDKFHHGECIAPYLSPFHVITFYGEFRFGFLVFEQPRQEKIYFDLITRRADPSDYMRTEFKWRDFAKKYGLGKPYAINFFRVEKKSKRPKKTKPADSEDSWLPFG